MSPALSCGSSLKIKNSMNGDSVFSNMSRLEIENHLIHKAVHDPAFRKELIESPRTALEKETGLLVPVDFELKVIEETSNSLCLVLPPAAGELSDLELEAVAGGKGSIRGPME